MSEKTSPDTVPGLGFKDKEKAFETLKLLEGRDPDYQRLAIKGLIGRAKRTLTLTKAEDKLQNIKDAMEVFDKWLQNFEDMNLGKENKAYLPLPSIKVLSSLFKKYDVQDKLAKEFLEAYKKVGGEYKHLRTVSSGENEPTWDIVRNSQLKNILKDIEENKPDMWDDGLPTEEHLRLIAWAYSPEASHIKKNLSKMEEKLKGDDSMDDEGSEEEESPKKNSSKRKSSSGSESSEEETPKKKSKK
ncbi:hypothetical protein PPYR_06944 [Photinus pyralis]|uniref:Uncharacterized protein n=1 Tax=Photinus pyralis TaxID=7054 RepID=A0A1Y1KX04_PHOPY|nr:uncharacterized protein LOC116169731 [Photinus pyralis]KAB0799064.1 hypothetical protein PPYR_06944 [Photinus pyralis]